MTSLKASKIEDWISELPEELLVSILSRLTLREAVRTSLISKRWRHVWTSISVLNFDAKLNNLPWSHRSYGDRDKYIDWVNHVLEKHRGPGIDELRICYDLDNSYWYPNKWIWTALLNRVSNLELNLSYESSSPGSCHSGRRCYIANRCVLVEFNFLKTLSLHAVTVESSIIEYLLHVCPLERLSIHINVALKSLEVVGQSLKLKHLEVGRCWSLETIEISDTNLVSFSYDGSLSRVILNNVPKLVEVSVKINEYKSIAQSMFPKLSCCFSQLEILRLTIQAKELESLSDIMLPEQKILKEFVLFVGGWLPNDSVLGYLAIIKNFPNLQRFVFQITCRLLNHDHDEERKDIIGDVREAARFFHPYLKLVEIEGYCNTCDFEVFKQIIENAVNLEKIIIDTRHPEYDIKSEEDNEELTKRSSLEQQLRAQLSPGVELVLS